jgi:hypothetical protein
MFRHAEALAAGIMTKASPAMGGEDSAGTQQAVSGQRPARARRFDGETARDSPALFYCFLFQAPFRFRSRLPLASVTYPEKDLLFPEVEKKKEEKKAQEKHKIFLATEPT